MKKRFKLDILGHDITVIQKKNLTDPDTGEPLMGYSINDKSLIYIDSGLEKSQKQDTLFHEISHHINWILSLDLQEETIHRLGMAINAMIKNNPELIRELIDTKIRG